MVNASTITVIDVHNSLQRVKIGKACGIDGLAGEHFKYAHTSKCVVLSLLFNCFLIHGYMPERFLKSAIVPIIKNKSGDSSDKNNYRPIALVTALSKIFEICLIAIMNTFLCTHDNQFGFKSGHSTDLCIYAVKSNVKYYMHHESPVYTCILDASKAFHRVCHWTLFKKLIARNVPATIIRILSFWYSMQTVCVKWGHCSSAFFKVTNGVRQGSVLSPYLFAVYVDDLSTILLHSHVGCYIEKTCVNHVFYADDLCLMAPSPSGLQTLIDLCYEYSITTDIMFNPQKSVCLIFKPKLYKLHCPEVFLNGEKLKYASSVKYLGILFNETMCDDDDILRQLRLLYIRCNSLLRHFSTCSIHVKLELFRSYCAVFYCPYMWTKYNKKTYAKIRVAYNNAHRRILSLPPRCSASAMFANNNLWNLDTLIRRSTHAFMQRLSYSKNGLVHAFQQSYLINYVIWDQWYSLLYTF
jgi:hypothetical protein